MSPTALISSRSRSPCGSRHAGIVDEAGQALLADVLGNRRGDSPLVDASRRFWRTRLDLAGVIVEGAIARGELPPDTDQDVVVEALLGALLMSREELDERFARDVADVISGPPARPKVRRRAAS